MHVSSTNVLIIIIISHWVRKHFYDEFFMISEELETTPYALPPKKMNAILFEELEELPVPILVYRTKLTTA